MPSAAFMLDMSCELLSRLSAVGSTLCTWHVMVQSKSFCHRHRCSYPWHIVVLSTATASRMHRPVKQYTDVLLHKSASETRQQVVIEKPWHKQIWCMRSHLSDMRASPLESTGGEGKAD